MNAVLQADPAFAPFLGEIADALARDDLECPTFVDASLGARLGLKNLDLSVAQVANIVSGEPLLSARVVAYANAAAVNRGGKAVTDVKTAVMRIGQNAVRNIAVALALRHISHARELEPVRQQAREILEHGLEVGVLSHVLALDRGTVAPDDALFAGLVHDLGHFYALWRAARVEPLAGRFQEVRPLVHDVHAALGAAMLRRLQLPDRIILAVHEHEDEPETLAPGSLSQILCVANRCANTPATDLFEAVTCAPGVGGAIDEAAAQRVLAEHIDEVTWLLASMRG